MDDLRKSAPRTETKIFDPRDPATGLDGAELLDGSLVQRDGQWWLWLANYNFADHTAHVTFLQLESFG